MNRVVIVGASAGGLATAEALRRSGFTGAVTLIGAEPHAPYDRPPLSKQLLAGCRQPDQLSLRPTADLDALRLDLRLGVPATGLDPARARVLLADGTTVGYDRLVVATGVQPRRLPGVERPRGLHTLRTLEDALLLRAALRPGRRLVIVGAGFIGAEVAGTARRLGAQVTLLEAGQAPLAQAIGAEAGGFLAQLHQDHGVDLRTGAAVAGIVEVGGTTTGVRLADGTVIPADDVLVSVGSVPNTEWLAGSGLPTHDGLVCDQYCVAAPGIYGVGDVCCWPNPLFGVTMRIDHRTNAAEQGLAVARNLLDPGKQRPFAPVPYVWSDQYDTKIQVYGYLRDHDEATVLDSDRGDGRLLVAYRKGSRLIGILAAGVPPKVLRGWRTLIASRTAWTSVPTGPATA